MTIGAAGRWAAVAAYMAGLFFLSSVTRFPLLPGAGPDKLVHLLLYAGLGAVSLRALAGGRWAGVTLARGLQAVAIATAYGALDEYHQSFVDGRTAEAADLAADATGALLAAGAAGLWVILTGKGRNSGLRSRN